MAAIFAKIFHSSILGLRYHSKGNPYFNMYHYMHYKENFVTCGVNH